jgi:hypothetical protein
LAEKVIERSGFFFPANFSAATARTAASAAAEPDRGLVGAPLGWDLFALNSNALDMCLLMGGWAALLAGGLLWGSSFNSDPLFSLLARCECTLVSGCKDASLEVKSELWEKCCTGTRQYAFIYMNWVGSHKHALKNYLKDSRSIYWLRYR